jgi:hypothetical protein
MNKATVTAVCGLLGAVLATSVFGAPQGKWPGPQGDTYRSIEKLPDWSGTWVIPDQIWMKLVGAAVATAPYISGYAERSRAAVSNATSCLTTGMPGIMAVPLGYEFLFTPGRVTILVEEGPTIRRVFTDGRSHAADPDPTFAGESIGHWEGQTLVVDTIAIKAKSEYFRGVKTSGQAHLVERIGLVDHDHLHIDTIVEDPVAFSKPWHYSLDYVRSDTGFIESYYCEQNRDANGEPNLQPP